MLKKVYGITFFTLFMVFIVSVQSVAQDTHRDLLKVMCEKSIVSNATTAVDALKEQYQGVVSAGKGRTMWRILLDEYFRTQYVDDLVDVILPYYEKHLTVDELKETMAQLDTPDAKKAMQNFDKIIGLLDDPDVVKYAANSIERILNGRKIAVPKDTVPESFKEKFNAMLDICQIDSLIKQMVREIDASVSAPVRGAKRNVMLPFLCKSVCCFDK